jgi:hypothetical protein
MCYWETNVLTFFTAYTIKVILKHIIRVNFKSKFDAHPRCPEWLLVDRGQRGRGNHFPSSPGPEIPIWEMAWCPNWRPPWEWWDQRRTRRTLPRPLSANRRLKFWWHVKKRPTNLYIERRGHIMLRDELTLKCVNIKMFSVLDTPEHVDSEKLNRQIRYGSWLDWFFSKRDLNS